MRSKSEPLLCRLYLLTLLIYEDICTPDLLSGNANAAWAAERIEHYFAGQYGFLNQILEECHWFLGGVGHSMGWDFIELEDIALAFAVQAGFAVRGVDNAFVIPAEKAF